MTPLLLTLVYDTQPGGVGTPLTWGLPEDEVQTALESEGVEVVSMDAGTMLSSPGEPRDVQIRVIDEEENIRRILGRFEHGPSWEIDEYTEED